MKYPEIKNWNIITTGTEYTAPECRSMLICGQIYRDPRFEDGKRIITSMIKQIEDLGDIIIAKTENSEYLLQKSEMCKGFVK